MKTFIVTTKKMVFGGSSIAEINGKTVFIPYSLPDETLEISITNEHKNYSQGKIEKILGPSAHRVKPFCPHFYECGGCNLQMADDDYQKELRLFMAREALERVIGNSAINSIKTEFVSGASKNYRARFQLHINEENRFAQKKAGSNKLIPINECPVASPAIQSLIRQGTEKLPKSLNCESKLAKTANRESAFAKTDNRLHIFSAGEKIFTQANADECRVKICGKTIRFNPLGFFQSNIEMTEKLISAIFANLKEEPCQALLQKKPPYRILDFYSGVGTISLFSMEIAGEIHLVEHNKFAQSYAKINFEAETAKLSQPPKIFYHKMSAEKWAKSKQAKLKFDIAFVDPPRSGIDKTVLAELCKSKIPQIFYVSCDPVSFARDTAKLLEAGYNLKKHILFDFYPQTHHIETLGIFPFSST